TYLYYVLSAVTFVHNSISWLFFFFFQAEDGIRYRNVTGVQTCALPILRWSIIFSAIAGPIPGRVCKVVASATFRSTSSPPLCPRSEERRVGKEYEWMRSGDSWKKCEMIRCVISS